MIAINDTMESKRIHLNDFEGMLEYVAVEVKIGTKNMIIYNAYVRAISKDKHYENMRKEIYNCHKQNIESINRNTNDIVLITGDLNFAKVKWQLDDEQNQLLPNYSEVISHKDTISDFIDTTLLNGYTQISNHSNKYGNNLELVFTNKPEFFDISSCEKPLVPSEDCHVPIELTFYSNDLLPEGDTDQPETIYCYKKTDFDKFKEYLNNTDFKKKCRNSNQSTRKWIAYMKSWKGE